jgi:hypothetical protein
MHRLIYAKHFFKKHGHYRGAYGSGTLPWVLRKEEDDELDCEPLEKFPKVIKDREPHNYEP